VGVEVVRLREDEWGERGEDGGWEEGREMVKGG
jgi:hypothetical protein